MWDVPTCDWSCSLARPSGAEPPTSEWVYSARHLRCTQNDFQPPSQRQRVIRVHVSADQLANVGFAQACPSVLCLPKLCCPLREMEEATRIAMHGFWYRLAIVQPCICALLLAHTHTHTPLTHTPHSLTHMLTPLTHSHIPHLPTHPSHTSVTHTPHSLLTSYSSPAQRRPRPKSVKVSSPEPGPSLPPPTTLEELLKRQWEETVTFLTQEATKQNNGVCVCVCACVVCVCVCVCARVLCVCVWCACACLCAP